jgi:hypothetical protein
MSSTIIIVENDPSNCKFVFAIVFQLLTKIIEKYKLKLTIVIKNDSHVSPPQQ